MDFFQLDRDVDLLGAFFDTNSAVGTYQGVAVGILLVDFIRIAFQLAVGPGGVSSA